MVCASCRMGGGVVDDGGCGGVLPSEELIASEKDVFACRADRYFRSWLCPPFFLFPLFFPLCVYPRLV